MIRSRLEFEFQHSPWIVQLFSTRRSHPRRYKETRLALEVFATNTLFVDTNMKKRQIKAVLIWGRTGKNTSARSNAGGAAIHLKGILGLLSYPCANPIDSHSCVISSNVSNWLENLLISPKLNWQLLLKTRFSMIMSLNLFRRHK